jgi:hypothetical protein
VDPDALRNALFSAIAANDAATFNALVNAHTPTILASFESWSTVPVAVRSDPAALEIYAKGLIGLAETFANAGRPELMAHLQRGGRDNPIERWQSSFHEADQHMEGGRHRHAITILDTVLGEMNGSQGTAIDSYRPKVLGMLGMAYFKIGDCSNAERRTREALEECRRTGDAEGAKIYAQNLEVIARTPPAS